MKSFHFVHFVLLGFVLLLPTGCGTKEQGTLVQGRVTLDGTPISSGRISFIGSDNSVQVFPIKDGSYSARVFPEGEKSVLFAAEKVVGQTPRNDFEGDTVMIEEYESILPKKYSKKGTFTMTIGSSPETKDFELTSGDK